MNLEDGVESESRNKGHTTGELVEGLLLVKSLTT